MSFLFFLCLTTRRVTTWFRRLTSSVELLDGSAGGVDVRDGHSVMRAHNVPN